MAEPAHQLDDSSVYDEPDGSAPSDPRSKLKALEGGGESTEPKRGHLREADSGGQVSREGLSSAEEKTEQSASEHENQVGRGYRQDTPQSGRSILRGRKTRVLFGGSIIGIVVSIIISFFATGPLEFIHLAQVLEKNFFHTKTDIQIRNKGLFRYARSGQVEETRLGKLGSVVYNRTLSQLKDQGIDFHRNGRGVPDAMTIDTAQNDNYKDLSGNVEQRAAIINDFEIKDPSIVVETKPGVFRVNLNNTSMKGIDFVKATTKTAIGSLGNGEAETALGFRYLKKAWDLPKLFSPIDKAKSVAKNKYASASAERKAADQAENQRTAVEEVAVLESPEVAPAKSKLAENADVFKGGVGAVIAGAAAGQLIVCTVRSVANDAVILNRAAVVAPAAIQSTDKIAIGSQVQSMKNFDTTQLAAAKDSLVDRSGADVWHGKALQVTEGVASPGGPDLPAKYGQAFSGATSADSIRKAINVTIFGQNVTDFACSDIGMAVTTLVGFGALLSGFFDGGASWGATAAFVGEQLAYAAATAGVVYVMASSLTDILKDKTVTPAVLSGPLGGNIMAYGARELGNVGARSMGGVAMDGTEKSVLSDADQKLYDQQFNSQPLAKRLFNVYDSRSVVSKLIDTGNLNPQGMVASIGHTFTNFGSMFTHAFSAIMPRALAANQPYDWGFPQYGIPSSVIQDSRSEDPYANADYVATNLLNPNDGAGATDSHNMSYIDKAMACFGVSISKDTSGLWSVVAQKDVNPGTDEYAKGHCNDTNDDWHKLMLFVMDSRLMDAESCQQGIDSQACTNIGEDDTSGSPAPSSPPPAGSDQQLAQQILNNSNVSYPLDASSPNGSTKQVLQALAGGQQAPVACTDGSAQGTTTTTVDPAILQFVLELGNQRQVGVNAITDKCHITGSNHYQGKAVDFECKSVAFDVNQADTIAKKYGLSRNNETCSANSHWHYSTNGR
jgi:hypothetical protein